MRKQLALEDSFDSLDLLKTKLNDAILLSWFLKVVKEISVEFHYIIYDDTTINAAKLVLSLIIFENLTVNAFVGGVLFPQASYHHLIKAGSLNSITQLCNILAFVKV